MRYPEFYNDVEKFILKDRLSEFLGATEDGIIEISYLDCVKLAGHSCPTVAGSYIAAKVALKHFYGEKMPLRSEIKIEFKESADSGVTGVIGSVIGFILGSSDEGGFAGIGGKFGRKGLVVYSSNSVKKGSIRFTKLDTQEYIEIEIDTSAVPANPKIPTLIQKALQNVATQEEIEEFRTFWQDRVKNMLLNRDIWNRIIKIVDKG